MYEKTRAAGFGEEVRRRIMIGTYVLSAGYYDAYYLRAQKVRTLIKRDFEDGLRRRRRRDPDAGDAVGRLRHRREGGADPVEMYLNDVFTVTVNMAGLPGIAVPAGLSARGPAARPAADRPAVRRGDAVLARRGDRAGGGTLHAGEVVVTMAEFKASHVGRGPRARSRRCRWQRCGGPPKAIGIGRTASRRTRRT